MTTPNPERRRTLRNALARALAEANRGELSIGDTAELIAEIIESWREANDQPADADVIDLASVVALSSGDPFVTCRVGGERWQWTPDDARGHALALIAVAEAATHDAAVVRWLQLGPVGLDRDTAIAALVDLRRYRGST